MSIVQSFEIIRISSCSDIPVRNTDEELIFGNHVLWEGKNTPVDDDGSLSPNVFSYDFTSPLSSNSTLNVTLSIVNKELCGTNLVLRGTTVGDSKLFESAVFTARDANEITIAVCIVDPEPCPRPISLNDDFTWTIVSRKHKQSDEIEHTCLDETLLELYWVSKNIHEIFYTGHAGIAIELLRAVVNDSNILQDENLARAAYDLYYSFNKTYDTVSGAPHFGVSYYGGHLQYRRYIAGTPQGSKYPTVNGYDQTAMVQILGTLRDRTPTWLLLEPFGYMSHKIHLVGYLYPSCNNPFFRSNSTDQRVFRDDPQRTGFRNHSFNGYYTPVSDEPIYDACMEYKLRIAAKLYVNSAIDKKTNLYGSGSPGSTAITRAGTVDDIKQYQGVTGVSRLGYGTGPSALDVDQDLKKLLSKYATSAGNAAAPYPRSYIDWDNLLSETVKELFGDSCEIDDLEVTIGDGVTDVFYNLTGIAGFDGDVIIKVKALTCVGPDGCFDDSQSCATALDALAFTLMHVEMDLGGGYIRLRDIWFPAPFDEYADYALQYGRHIDEGRVLLVCDNSFIEISGGSSSAALEPVINKLLTYTTTVDARVSLHVPRLSKHLLKISQTHQVPNFPQRVKGLFASFNVECHVDCLIADASADTEGHGLLLSKYNIEKDEDNETSTVIFMFVTRAIGVHNVNLRFKKALTMTTNTEKIQVTVVDG